MSNTAIKVENLSKIYRLGEIGTGTISRDMERWFKTKVLKQEDPFLKIGETNDRANKGMSDIVYSLQDINFEINQGDAVGIIGRNGAGKSTLLKILSRVTTPTTGKINIKGRVASLLEVGTGFHPELTGRENIYLNGAILGMRKREIDRKLDEIIDFSGVERYIDTPVKRYSSGMYVRLAFAVAAHLESEILIVDEVLAVGDAEFQKKCLGKMGDVSKGEGRTVLFVSHNMAAVQQLCNSALCLENGSVKEFGLMKNIVDNYLSTRLTKSNHYKYTGKSKLNYLDSCVSENITGSKTEIYNIDDSIILKMTFKLIEYSQNTKFSITIQRLNEEFITTIIEEVNSFQIVNNELVMKIFLQSGLITPGNYAFRIALFCGNSEIYDVAEMICPITIVDNGSKFSFISGNYGHFFINYDIKVII
jgi:lipopolysaccharide transport system ATP-binding protein